MTNKPASDLTELSSRFPARFPPPFAKAWGDDAYGLYADLILSANSGRVRQRMRWIEAGSFMMGSPETEAGRFEDEGPQHEVRLSEGFWLFDTPCTQALWQAVMGENPSQYRSPERPVESVSWDDVQQFLERINGLVPGLELSLPAEAQWEYACRAGTRTATYVGDLIILGANNAPVLDAIAWYRGNSSVDYELRDGYDSSAWTERQYSGSLAGTHPVGLKTPNDWGLYDMLGNVWEWCADGKRNYGLEAVIDPVGPAGTGVGRVLRGGSWCYGPRFARAACRRWYGPGGRFDDSGFRCARVQKRAEPGKANARLGQAERGGEAAAKMRRPVKGPAPPGYHRQ